MRIPRRLWATAALPLILAIIGWNLMGGKDQPNVATITVHPGLFVQRVTAQGNLEAVHSIPLNAPMSGNRPFKIAWMVADGSHVSEGDIVVRFDPTDLEEEREESQTELNIVGLRLEKARVERETVIKNLERDAALAQEEAANVISFRNTDDQIYSRNEIIESEIDTELAEKRADHAEQAQDIENQLSLAGVELLEIEQHKVELKIKQADEGLESLLVIAPKAGIVTFERDWRGDIPHVGEQVWPGRPLASMPQMDAMQAVVYVLEADAGGLGAGQRAHVVLEAHPERSFSATIESVDPVAQPRIRWVPVQYFRTILTLEETLPGLMKPGGRVHAEILVAEEENVIAVPRQAVVNSDGVTTINRLDGRDFVPVEVTMGTSAGGRVVITSGLSDGDVIALRNPTEEKAASTPPGQRSSLGGS